MADKKYDGGRPNIPADIDRSVRTQAGHRCSITFCNEHTYLEIHHIEENRANNNIDNLILLCDKHHKMAHAGKIDRKSLREYKNKLNINIPNLNLLDIKAVQYFQNKIPPEGVILRLRNEEFIGRLEKYFVDSIHELQYFWQSPYAQFQDAELQNSSKELLASCERLSRTLAQKTFGARDGADYYEIPPEYPTDHFYNEANALINDARAVCAAYDSFARNAISKGLNF